MLVRDGAVGVGLFSCLVLLRGAYLYLEAWIRVRILVRQAVSCLSLPTNHSFICVPILIRYAVPRWTKDTPDHMPGPDVPAKGNPPAPSPSPPPAVNRATAPTQVGPGSTAVVSMIKKAIG